MHPNNPKGAAGHIPYSITAPNGLRIVCDCNPDAHVEYVAAMIDAGSRDDPEGQEGIAHLVEHTIFKGTSRLRSSTIINTMERLGGELNAYTTKELTAVYSVFPAGHARKAANLIAELISDSQFPDDELEKEREVVIDEINSYLDIPAENIFDEFEDLAFAATPLGHNILGSADTVRSITSAHCRTYLTRLYRAGSVVVAYSGPLPPHKAARMLEKAFDSLSTDAVEGRESKAQFAPPFRVERQLALHQANVVMGAPAPSLVDTSRYAMLLLVNMLGGPSMNSRLNIALREKRGLVYSVESWVNMYADTGLAAVYFGCDPSDVKRCMGLVSREIEKLANAPLSPASLMAAKRQYIGQLTVASDNRESRLLGYARQMLHYGRINASADTAAIILDISAEQLRQAAERLTAPSVLIMQ